MKKLINSIIVVLMVASVISGCKNGSTPASLTSTNNNNSNQNSEKPEASQKSSEVVNLTYWYSWTDKIQENNENLTKQFNDTVGKDLGIKVTAQGQGTYDELHQKLQASYVAGSTPSVTVMEIASIKTFAENGVIENLSPYIERDNIDMNDFYEGLLSNCEVDKIWYGIPYLRSTPILYINATLLEKAGLDPKGPKSWEELDTFAKEIKEKTGAFGFESSPSSWYYEAFMFQQDSTILSEDEKISNINSEESKFVVNFFNDLNAKGYIRMLPQAESSQKIRADVMNQTVAMWLGSTADLTYYLSVSEENSFKINTNFIPKSKQYGVPTGGCNLIMSTKISDKEKEASWEFIKWMTTKEQTAYASAYTGYVPTRKSASETDTIKGLHDSMPQFSVALEQLNEYGHGRPMNPGYKQGQKILMDSLEKIWINGEDVDTTLKEAEDQMNSALK